MRIKLFINLLVLLILIDINFLYSQKKMDVLDIKGGFNTFGFQPNMGQISDFGGTNIKDVLFFTRHSGIDLYVKGDGVSYVIRDVKGAFRDVGIQEKMSLMEKEIEQDTMIWARVDLRVVGGSLRKGMIEYSEPMDGYTNYYLSHCPDGVLFVPSYRVVRIREVYPGVDWVWRIGEDGLLHHEFDVEEGVDISKIKLEVKWADVKLSDDGKRLRLSTPVGEIEDGEIFGYDDRGKVELSYVVEGSRFVSFSVEGKYQGRLTIDPPLARLWATYYGGSSDDIGYSITTDASGNVFMTGWTTSTDFPTYNPGGGAYYQGSFVGGSDVFILKFSNSGVRLWTIYYGGSDDDRGYSIATDAQDNVFVTGSTYSPDFPTYNPSGGAYYQGSFADSSDVFILKFTNNGLRLWATYYGGNNYEGGWSITIDTQGNVYITGETSSTNFPTQNAHQPSFAGDWDTFIAKFSSNGVLLWSTYFGGSSGEEGLEVKYANGKVFVVGYTYSTDFPTYNPGGGAYYQGSSGGGIRDVVIFEFSDSGILLWATYLGGNDDEVSRAITTDISGNVFVFGYTYSTDFPTYNPGGGAYYQNYAGNGDCFMIKFSSNRVLLWSTYYGGSDKEGAFGYLNRARITSDANGNVYATGYTYSTDFPTYNPGGGAYYDSSWNGIYDVFILKFSNSGVRQWSTYYGGSNYNYGHSIATDAQGNVFVTGRTNSTDFSTYNPGGGVYYQGNNAGGYDAFILKFEGENVNLSVINLSKMWLPGDYWKPVTYDGHTSQGKYYAADFYYSSRNRPDTYLNGDIVYRGRPILAAINGDLFVHLLDVTNSGSGNFPLIDAKKVFQGIDPVPLQCFSMYDSLNTLIRIDMSLVIDFNSNKNRLIYVHLQIDSSYFIDQVKQKIRDAIRKFYNRSAPGNPRKVAVSLNINILAGSQVGTINDWGIASRPHLHFQVFQGYDYSESSPYLGTPMDLSDPSAVTIESQVILPKEYEGTYGDRYHYPAILRRTYMVNSPIIANSAWDGGSTVNLRESPGGQIITVINNETVGYILQSKPQYAKLGSNNYIWYNVQFGNYSGWVVADYIEPYESAITPSLTFIQPHYQRTDCFPIGVSDDGSVVAGISMNANGLSEDSPWANEDASTQRAFTWYKDSGSLDLGTLGLERTWANSLSRNGKYVVGGYYTGSYSWRAFRWSQNSGMIDLGSLGIDWVEALDVSDDGSTVVGYSYTQGDYYWWAVYGFKWTIESGMISLGKFPNYRFTHAFGTSSDGKKIVGIANLDAVSDWNKTQAWIWDSTNGYIGLGLYGNQYTYVTGISSNGNWVIGMINNGVWPDPWVSPYSSFIWSSSTGYILLGTLGGDKTYVSKAITEHGEEVFGGSKNPSGEWRAFRWTKNNGQMIDLNSLYSDVIPSNWVLINVTDCSRDGRYLVGIAKNTQTNRILGFLIDNKRNFIPSTVVENKEISRSFVIYQNYPNPFNSQTEITFDLPEAGKLEVELFNVLGEKVATLYNGFMDAGFGKLIRWNADGFSSGVYFYRVSLNGKYVGVKKMVLMK